MSVKALGVRLPLPPLYFLIFMEEEYSELELDLDEDVYQLAVEMAKEKNITLNELIVMAIEEALKNQTENYDQIPERY